jgi:2,5-diamino-6-(ribosylamino)-4(3H)-pyrimidinone 5'-phosphate reductase
MKVTSNTAISLDGRINTRERRFVFFGSAEDHRRMSRLRMQADAVLVGGATFRNWPHAALPDPADRGALRTRPWNVVVSRRLDVPLLPEFLAEAAIRPLFLTRAASLRADFPAEAEGWEGESADLPIGWILEQLERRGVERLLVEAGGDLLFQFLAAGARRRRPRRDARDALSAGRRRRRAGAGRGRGLRLRRAAPAEPARHRNGGRRGLPPLPRAADAGALTAPAARAAVQPAGAQ